MVKSVWLQVLFLRLLGAHLLRLGSRGGGAARLELLDASRGVDELLLARVERMTIGADFDAHIFLRGARDEGAAARADHFCVGKIGRMNVLFHNVVYYMGSV